MKVLQITTNYPCKENPIYGIFMKEQVDSLEEFGIINNIIFSNGLKSNPKIKFSAIFIHLKTAIRLYWHLKSHKYDIIHCHSAVSGLILFLARGFKDNRTIWSLQNDPDHINTPDGKFIRRLINKFDKIIVKKKIKLNNNNNNIIYLPNGVNLNLFRPMNKNECKNILGLDSQKRYILFVDSNTYKGRSQKRKDRFDKVLTILADKFGHKDIEQLVMTKTRREDVPIWMNACELYLLSSDEEGSPNAVKECMACNVPVISTPVGNIVDLFEDVKDCKVSKTFDPEELATLVHDTLIMNQQVNTRNSIILKNLDMQSVARNLYSIYCATCHVCPI